jgi:hypothetical protein
MNSTVISLKEIQQWYRSVKQMNGNDVPKVISRYGKALRKGVPD